MNCPICKTTNLVMTSRENVEIDYCPDCRGVWLDRGELDKIIERSNPPSQSDQQNLQTPNYQNPPQYQDNVYPQNMSHSGGHSSKHGNNYGGGHNNSNNYNNYPRKKKDGWLGELFDF